MRVSLALLLTLIFGIALTIIAKVRNIRDKSVVMLVLNMVATAFLFCCLVAFVSTADVVTANSTPPLLCFPSLSLGTGALIAFKLSTLCLAVEQFVAVVFPLRHLVIMSRWARRMIALTWLFVVLFTSFGLLAYFLGLRAHWSLTAGCSAFSGP